jgi:RNA polymerase sigma-70 factor (ECF subfamily)
MRSEWEVLHRDLVRSVETKEAERRFEALRRRLRSVARFAGAQALVDHLAHVGGDLDEKDRILMELAFASRTGPSGRLATALLLLGLWPGLDAAFRRRARIWHDHRELTTEMVAKFTDQVRRLHSQRVHRVAATLVRSTEREVVRASIREQRRRRRISNVPIEVAEGRTVPPWAPEEIPSAARAASDLCPSIGGGSLEQEIAGLRAWIAGFVGSDADLVIDAVVLNRSRRELGAERGIDEPAARKRLQRALGRVRRCLEPLIPVSRDDRAVAFPRA